MDSNEFYWIVGLLEGEGSFVAGPPSNPGKPQISLQMCDEDVIARAATILGGYSYCRCKPRKAHHKESFQFLIRGKPAVDFMLLFRPYMSRRRQQQIDFAVQSFSVNEKHWMHKNFPSTEEMKELRNQGLSLRKIAKQLGCSHQLVAKRMASDATGVAA